MAKRPGKSYWKYCSALYGDQIELGVSQVPPKRRIAPRSQDCPTEQDEQFVFVAWLQKNGIPHYHVPNGGYRDAREASKFKRLGVSAGVPDICIPMARKSHHGLYIELKRVSGGRLSENQIAWRDILVREGYRWEEAKGAARAIEIVQSYLS